MASLLLRDGVLVAAGGRMRGGWRTLETGPICPDKVGPID
ncbi:unnamed protein product [Ciceribacter selenitireducens ATCC BAA-1503]|uniref:Uncharacterized protein n=1 Tax=Ciceribacter selenitireducens ATCC BAA-1503 TaxID=1336235 RepID=A0A376ABP5_9HYPH|nr:unnamed protein product [Ciceribacter selenitireducens ATCC BAA-1503]